MNGNDSGVADARDRLREKAQNEATCIALNDMLKDAQKEIVRLREENERLKSNQTQLLSPWQPIATAPKDGTDILIMTRETMHVVRWENVHGDFYYWVVDDNKHGPFTLRGNEPTHWMPLPEPAP